MQIKTGKIISSARNDVEEVVSYALLVGVWTAAATLECSQAVLRLSVNIPLPQESCPWCLPQKHTQEYMRVTHQKLTALPWLVQLSGLSAGLQTQRSPVRFPVRVHA